MAVDTAIDIERKPVTSSNIAAIGYDAKALLMDVEFSSGTVYRYDGVGQETYDGLVAAESIGTHFSSVIKGKFPYTKL